MGNNGHNGHRTQGESRLVAVDISLPLLSDMVKQGWKASGLATCIEGVPPDAAFLGLLADAPDDCVSLLFSHASFPPVVSAIPRRTVVWKVNPCERLSG